MFSKIIMTTNIGLGASKKDLTDYHKNTTQNTRPETYARLYDRLGKTYNDYSRHPDIMAIQELGYLGFVPRPFYDKPAKHRRGSTVKYVKQGKRGWNLLKE